MEHTVIDSTLRGTMLLRRVRVTFEDELRSAGSPEAAAAYLERLTNDAPGCYLVLHGEPLASQIVSLGVYANASNLWKGQVDKRGAYAILNTAIRFGSAEDAARFSSQLDCGPISRRREKEEEEPADEDGGARLEVFREFVDGSGFLSKLPGGDGWTTDPETPPEGE